MANKYMADYLDALVADYTVAELSIRPCKELSFTPKKEQIVFSMASGNSVAVDVSDNVYFEVPIDWNYLVSSDAGTILDLYTDATKMNFHARSGYWVHPIDGYTYTFKFSGEVTFKYKAGWGTRQQIGPSTLKIIGVKPN